MYLATKNNISLPSSLSLSLPFQTSRSEKDCTRFPRCTQTPFQADTEKAVPLKARLKLRSFKKRGGLPTSILLPYLSGRASEQSALHSSARRPFQWKRKEGRRSLPAQLAHGSLFLRRATATAPDKVPFPSPVHSSRAASERGADPADVNSEERGVSAAHLQRKWLLSYVLQCNVWMACLKTVHVCECG